MVSMRDEYAEHGVVGFYRLHGSDYRNPHVGDVRASVQRYLQLQLPGPAPAVLDLAAGSGEVSSAVLEAAPGAALTAVDPFTGAAYEARTGRRCLPRSFRDVADGALGDARFDLAVCSYALHLAGGDLFPLLWELSWRARRLLVLSAGKRPEIRSGWGWERLAGVDVSHGKCRARVYESTHWAADAAQAQGGA